MKTIVLVLGMWVISGVAVGGQAGNRTEKDIALAWSSYENGEYENARQLVDKHYSKDNVSLSLLSGMLYAKEGKCDEAIGAIAYISKYYDEHAEEIKKDDRVFDYYVNMKRLSIECNRELQNWSELIEDLEHYLAYISGPERMETLAILGDAEVNRATSSLEESVEIYERILRDSDGVETAISEHCMFNLIGLYSIMGQQNSAVDMAEELLNKTKKKSEWINEMKESGRHLWLLREPNIARHLEEEP